MSLRDGSQRTGDVVEYLYQQRKSNFAEVLERTIQYFQQDSIGRQMLQNYTSGVYIADRIEEIIVSMINDDREKYIDQIISKLRVFENLFKEEQAEIERILGDDINLISEIPDSTHRGRIKCIHLIAKTLKKYKGDLMKLREEMMQKDVLLRGLGNNKRIDYDPKSPTFMHVFSELDITKLDQFLKNLIKEANESKKAVSSMDQKMKRMIEIMKSQTSKAIDLYNQRISKLESRAKTDKNKINELKDLYDQKVTEIDSITTRLHMTDDKLKTTKAMLETTENNLGTLRYEFNKLQDSKNQIESQFFSIRNENNKYMKEIQRLTHENEEKNHDLVKISSENQHVVFNLQTKDTELKKLTVILNQKENFLKEISEKIEEKDRVIEELKNKRDKLKSSANDLNTKMERYKEHVDGLEASNQLLSEKVESLKNELNRANVTITKQAKKIEEISVSSQTKSDKMELELQVAMQKTEKLAKLVQEQEQVIGRQKETIDKGLIEQDTLSNNLAKVKGEYTALNSQYENLKTSTHTQIESLTKVLQNKVRDNEKLEMANHEQQEKLMKIQGEYKQLKVIHDAATVKYNNVHESNEKTTYKLNQLMDKLNIMSDQDPETVIEKLHNSDSMLKRIKTLMNDKDDKSIFSTVQRMKNQYESICHKLGTNPTSDIAHEVSQLLDDKRTANIDAQDAVEFIAQMFRILTGQDISVKKITFPMSTSRKQQLLDQLTNVVSAAKEDRGFVENIIKQANKLGYDGNNVAEALEHIVKTRLNNEKQVALEQTNKQIEDLRAELEEQFSRNQVQYNADIERRVRDISELRNKIVQLSESKNLDREEFEKQTLVYERQIRELTDQLNTEKTLRKELGRIGAGATADKNMLKSKLTAQEYKFIEFIDKMMRSEREAKAIHDGMKRARQANLDISN